MPWLRRKQYLRLGLSRMPQTWRAVMALIQLNPISHLQWYERQTFIRNFRARGGQCPAHTNPHRLAVRVDHGRFWGTLAWGRGRLGCRTGWGGSYQQNTCQIISTTFQPILNHSSLKSCIGLVLMRLVGGQRVYWRMFKKLLTSGCPMHHNMKHMICCYSYML